MSVVRSGLFINLEGVDGVGKTTQIELLAAWLEARGEQVVITSEPEGTPLGEAVGGWLRGHGAEAPVPRAEALLFLAARAQHVATVIRPALAAGAVVVCSRFTESTLAYQGYGLGLPLAELAVADGLAREGCQPDGVLVLDLAAGAALERRGGRTMAEDAIEARAAAFHQRVVDGFRALAAAEPARRRLIDASGSTEETAALIQVVVGGWLAERGR